MVRRVVARISSRSHPGTEEGDRKEGDEEAHTPSESEMNEVCPGTASNVLRRRLSVVVQIARRVPELDGCRWGHERGAVRRKRKMSGRVSWLEQYPAALP